MDITNLIPWSISAISLLFVILTFLRNGNKDNLEEERKDEAKMESIKEGLIKANMKLDQVCATTNETRSDIKALNKDMGEIDRRLTIVERDVKTAFNKIDDIRGEIK